MRRVRAVALVPLALGALLAPAGCSAVVGRSNAGIAVLEGAPLGAAATGAKYAGWVAGAPLDAALLPVAALAWALPCFDLADAADVFTLPSVGLGYVLGGAVGAPLYAATFWADEREDPCAPPDAPSAPWGFVTAHRPAASRETASIGETGGSTAPISSADAAYYAVPEGAAERLAAGLERSSAVALEGFDGTLELTLAGDSGPRPLVLLTPPSEALFAARWLAARLARTGFHAAVIVPRDEVFLDPALDAAGIEAKLRGAVVAGRTAVAALASRSDVSAVRYLGVSAGGIYGTCLLALEPRIERAALIEPGGDLPHLVMTSAEGTVVAYREAWQARGVDPGAAFAEHIRTDPARLARYVDPARVLLFLSNDDTLVPIACGLSLREALGCPETWFLAGDHETSGICFGFVVRESERFLN